MNKYILPEGMALVVRVCTEQLTSHGGFQWPASGPVSAPDWSPVAECGQGLHGWLWGQGDYSVASETRQDRKAKWLVVEVKASDLVNINGKVKYPRGSVVYCGFWWDAFAFARKHRPRPQELESTATGNYGHAAATGDYGHAAAAGNYGIACGLGKYAIVKAGDKGAIIATYWDDESERMRVIVGYVGEDGIEAGKAYRVQDKKFVEAQS
jgi:hypothetical protein